MATKNVTPRELAQEWRVSTQYVYKQIANGTVKAIRVPGSNRLLIERETA